MTTLKASGENSLLVTIADEGASLSVHFPCVKFHHLLGWEAYTDARYDEPRWVWVPDDPNRPKFTERQGRFAPFKKVHIRERDPEVHGQDRSLEFRFDPGPTYPRHLRVHT